MFLKWPPMSTLASDLFWLVRLNILKYHPIHHFLFPTNFWPFFPIPVFDVRQVPHHYHPPFNMPFLCIRPIWRANFSLKIHQLIWLKGILVKLSKYPKVVLWSSWITYNTMWNFPLLHNLQSNTSGSIEIASDAQKILTKYNPQSKILQNNVILWQAWLQRVTDKGLTCFIIDERVLDRLKKFCFS